MIDGKLGTIVTATHVLNKSNLNRIVSIQELVFNMWIPRSH